MKPTVLAALPAVAVRHDVVDDDGRTMGSKGEKKERGKKRNGKEERDRRDSERTLARGWHSRSGG